MNEHDFDLDSDWEDGLTEEEIDEIYEGRFFEEHIDLDRVAEEESRPHMLNPECFKRIHGVYNMLKRAAKSTKLKVEIHLNEPFSSMGYISVVGASIRFSNARIFKEAAIRASNVDIYVRRDGLVQADFTFHELAKAL